MIVTLINGVYIFSELIIWLILIRCFMSWFVTDPYSTAGKIYGITIRLTEPIVEPCRKLLGRFNTGMFDFSLLVAFILVEVVSELIIKLLYMLV